MEYKHKYRGLKYTITAIGHYRKVFVHATNKVIIFKPTIELLKDNRFRDDGLCHYALRQCKHI